MATIRNTSKQYKAELQHARATLRATESRIINRALDLCQRFPDVMVGKITDARYFRTYHFEQPQSLTIENYLHAIEAIETYIASQQPYKQAKIEGF